MVGILLLPLHKRSAAHKIQRGTLLLLFSYVLARPVAASLFLLHLAFGPISGRYAVAENRVTSDRSDLLI